MTNLNQIWTICGNSSVILIAGPLPSQLILPRNGLLFWTVYQQCSVLFCCSVVLIFRCSAVLLLHCSLYRPRSSHYISREHSHRPEIDLKVSDRKLRARSWNAITVSTRVIMLGNDRNCFVKEIMHKCADMYWPLFLLRVLSNGLQHTRAQSQAMRTWSNNNAARSIHIQMRCT